jgi:hypothetical protein
MLRAAEFDGSVTPSHWRRSNWLLHVCCAVLVFSDRGSGRPLLFLRWFSPILISLYGKLR